MSPIGDLARQDEYDLPDVGQPLIPGGPQFSPGTILGNKVADVLSRYPGHVMGSLATLPERAFGASEEMRAGGDYNPAPAVEAALTTMGTGAIAGVPVRGAETALGAGPIRAYHSSPYDFERFDASKIGTGEGAQVYGHGLYFAENPAVSGRGGEYWKQFANRFDPQTTEGLALARLREADLNRTQAAKAASAEAGRFEQMARGEDLGIPPDRMSSRDLRQWEHQRANFLQRAENERMAETMLRNKKAIVGPRTYEVDINADPAHFLDWDKSLSAHPADIQSNLQKLNVGSFIKSYPGEARPPTGEALYNYLRANRGTVTAAEKLNEAGIPGIKYLDQQSRLPDLKIQQELDLARRNLASAQSPRGDPRRIGMHQAEITRLEAMMQAPKTSNYVVFNPGIIDILRKYGIAAAPTGALGALAAQDQYNQP